MLIGAPLLLIGLLIGLAVRRWSLVAVVAVLGVVSTVVAWPSSWFNDSDTPASGGALIFALVAWGPLLVGVAIGVHVARERVRSGRPPSSM